MRWVWVGWVGMGIGIGSKRLWCLLSPFHRSYLAYCMSRSPYGNLCPDTHTYIHAYTHTKSFKFERAQVCVCEPQTCPYTSLSICCSLLLLAIPGSCNVSLPLYGSVCVCHSVIDFLGDPVYYPFFISLLLPSPFFFIY